LKTLAKNIWFVAISLTSLLIPRTFNAKDIKQALNLNEAMKGKSYSQYFTALREGEFLVDTSFIYISAFSDQRSSAVAFDGTNYLVVWQDSRNDLSYDIYGARVTQSGTILDPIGIPISVAVNSQGVPSVAFDGTNYLVVWADGRTDQGNIYGARVNQTGVVLDTNGIGIAVAPSGQWYPSVSFDGTNFFIVWEDYRNNINYADIYGARVTPSGIVLDTSGIPISTTADAQEDPSVAFDGTNYLVVWEDMRSGYWDLYGARVNQSGSVIDTIGIPIATGPYRQVDPSVAFDGLNYLVAWGDRRNSVDDIYGTRVSLAGIVLDTLGIPISSAVEWQVYPSVAFDGTNYFVTWLDCRSAVSYDIYGARVSPSGVVIDSMGIGISTSPNGKWDPAVACGITNYLIAWEDSRSSSHDIYGARVNQSGNVIDSSGIVISTGVNCQRSPTIVSDGTTYFIAWEDNRSDLSYDIYAMRLDQSGNPLDTNSIVVCVFNNRQYYPCAAFDGINYFSVWQDWRNMPADIYGARVSQSGVVLDTAGIPITTALNLQWFPSVTFDGTNHLVIWQDMRNGNNDIYGARISQLGVVLDTSGIAVSTTPASQTFPSIAFDGTNYLAVWSDRRSGEYDIYCARINPSGVVLDTSGLCISDAVNDQLRPSVAFDGVNFFIVWEDYRNNISYADIYGARVTPSGIVLDTSGLAISTVVDDQVYSKVAFDSADYLVIWQDHRSGSEWDIYGAKVDTSGMVLNTYAVSTQPKDQYRPALAKGNGYQILITYAGWADSINTHPANTMRIWGKFYPFVGIEEDLELTKQVTKFSLQIYPNPINKQCNIKYNLPREIKVNISMFDVTGRLIKEIINEKQNVGIYNKTFDMTDLPQGVYFIRLKTEKQSDTKKIILIK
jgi:hypothetical protein